MKKGVRSRGDRARAREEARKRLRELHAARVLVNDPRTIHVTVFLRGNRRVEWWPGTRRWMEGTISFRGGFDDFNTWLKEQQ